MPSRRPFRSSRARWLLSSLPPLAHSHPEARNHELPPPLLQGMAEIKAKKPRRRSWCWRQLLICLGASLGLYCVFFVFRTPRGEKGAGRADGPSRKHRLIPNLLNSLFLTEKQCSQAFPGLTQSIDDIVAEGPFTVRDRGDLGPLQGRIKDGKVSSDKNTTG